MSPPSFSRDTRSRLGSSFRGPCVSWAVVWQTRPIAITANKEARRLLRPRFKTVFTGYLIIRLGAEVTVNQHFAFRHHCGQHSYVLRFGILEFSQNFFARCCHCRSHIRRLPHARGIDRADDVSTSDQGQCLQTTNATSSSIAIHPIRSSCISHSVLAPWSPWDRTGSALSSTRALMRFMWASKSQRNYNTRYRVCASKD